MKEVYLDNAATTKVDEKVMKKMLPFLKDNFGNPSSLHYKGEEAKRELDWARGVVAKSLGAKFGEIVFTGSGTEANNFVLKGLFWKAKAEGKNHIITTKIEHDCVLNSCKWLESQGAEVTYLDVCDQGFVNPQDLRDAITDKTFVVSIIHGNNEIGTIQNLAKLARVCNERGVLFHTDACQSFTKVPIDVRKMGVDLVTINAHKIHGPKGVGVLYIRDGIKIDALLHGGGQESKLRSSTENVSGIVGFAWAIKVASGRDVKNMKKMRDYFIGEMLEVADVKLNGASGDERLCNNINLSFSNIEGEAIGSFLNAKGIFTSTGSACSSKKLESSHVLTALGLNHLEANSSVRFSISKYTTKEEIDYGIQELKKTIEKLRKMSPLVG
jgi:cysteine desulfurase